MLTRDVFDAARRAASDVVRFSDVLAVLLSPNNSHSLPGFAEMDGVIDYRAVTGEIDQLVRGNDPELEQPAVLSHPLVAALTASIHEVAEREPYTSRFGPPQTQADAFATSEPLTLEQLDHLLSYDHEDDPDSDDDAQEAILTNIMFRL